MRLHLLNVTFCTYVDVAAVDEFAAVAFIVVEQDT